MFVGNVLNDVAALNATRCSNGQHAGAKQRNHIPFQGKLARDRDSRHSVLLIDLIKRLNCGILSRRNSASVIENEFNFSIGKNSIISRNHLIMVRQLNREPK